MLQEYYCVFMHASCSEFLGSNFFEIIKRYRKGKNINIYNLDFRCECLLHILQKRSVGSQLTFTPANICSESAIETIETLLCNLLKCTVWEGKKFSPLYYCNPVVTQLKLNVFQIF